MDKFLVFFFEAFLDAGGSTQFSGQAAGLQFCSREWQEAWRSQNGASSATTHFWNVTGAVGAPTMCSSTKHIPVHLSQEAVA